MRHDLNNFRLYGFATGGYYCKCHDCGSEFTGDKRATQCLDCAINTAESLHTDMKERVCQAHMSGQRDAGCKSPSWSTAFAYYTNFFKSPKDSGKVKTMDKREPYVSNSSSCSFMMIGIGEGKRDVIEDYLQKHVSDYDTDSDNRCEKLWEICEGPINGLDLQMGHDSDEMYLGLYPNEVLTTMLLPEARKKVVELINDSRVTYEDVTLFSEVIEG